MGAGKNQHTEDANETVFIIEQLLGDDNLNQRIVVDEMTDAGNDLLCGYRAGVTGEGTARFRQNYRQESCMMEMERFDPFNNRLCRNVRNALSESFNKVLEQKKMEPVHRVAGFFLNDPLPVCVKAYIDRRLAAYEKVLADVCSRGLDDPLAVAVAIWDRQIFFETHEYLEQYWMGAGGDEKRLFQAMIRAAGAYVHLEQGNLAAARRIAGKAIDGLERHRNRLAPYADPELLLDRLRKLDPVAPVLSGTAQ